MANQIPSPVNSSKKPAFYYGYVIVFAAFLILMIIWGAQYSFGVFFKPLLNDFGWSRAITSGAYAMNMFLAGFFGIFTGRLCDRFGPRFVITACGIIVGAGYLLMSRVTAVWQIYLYYGLFLAITMVIWVPLISTVARWFDRKRGMASGIVAAGAGFGIIFMPPVANQLISRYTWQTSYIIIGLAAMILIVILAQFLRREPVCSSSLSPGPGPSIIPARNPRAREFSLREAAGTREFWMISVALFSFAYGLQTVMVHMVPYATDIGFSAGEAAVILSVIGIISVAAKIGMGSAGDRIGNHRVLVLVFVLLAASFFWLMTAGQLWMLYLFAVIFGLGYGASVAVQSPLIADFFSLKAHGAIFGLAMFVANTGGAVGPLIAGGIYDARGSYQLAFLICGGLEVMGIILAVLLRAPSSIARKDRTALPHANADSN